MTLLKALHSVALTHYHAIAETLLGFLEKAVLTKTMLWA
jgi:hypothetical protein